MAEYQRRPIANTSRPRVWLPSARIHGMGALLGIAVFLTGMLAYTSFAMGQQPAPLSPPKETPDKEPPLSDNNHVFGILSANHLSPTLFQFTIDPKTPWHDLLPSPPKAKSTNLPGLPLMLRDVPEVSFQEPLARSLKPEIALKETAHRFAKIHHLNQEKTDGFMEKLLSKRADLAGLPMAMGDSCRMKERRRVEFATALRNIRDSVRSSTIAAPVVADQILEHFRRSCEGADNASESLHSAMVAVLMQVLGPETEELRTSMIKTLTRIPHRDATRALAQLAIFAEEEAVRRASREALQVRRESDYTDILAQGLSYPWPAVARRSAEAIVKLQRNDLIPNLLRVLDSPDPRAAQERDGVGKKTHVVRELVRINHHHNCLLCHAPVVAKADIGPLLLAEMPIPSQELAKPSAQSGAYENTRPDILVRIDVTYLRQDFSVKLPVADAAPWPDMQRFDFVVRTREVSDQEAQTLRDLLRPREPGVLSPYHRAALFALRELTGRDTEPTAQAWRKLLGM